MGKIGRPNPSRLIFPLLLTAFLGLVIAYATGVLVFDRRDGCKDAGGRWRGGWKMAYCESPSGNVRK